MTTERRQGRILMKVHTLVETEESFSDPLSVDVVGSYESLSFARKALVNRILARAQDDMAFAYAIWNDVNRGEEFREYMIENTCRRDVASYFDREVTEKKFPDDVERVMRLFLLENVKGEETYHIYVGDASEHMIHFDIKCNELHGMDEIKELKDSGFVKTWVKAQIDAPGLCVVEIIHGENWYQIEGVLTKLE